jgi:phenylacetate-coenzyme A ligase PaaK-like adenylate-forming protein
MFEAQYQLAKIRETVRRVRLHSPFYKERLRTVTEDEIRSTGDLQRLPFTTADDLIAHSAQFLCVSQSEVSRVVTVDTSGTTGRPKRVYFSTEDQELTVDFFHHALTAFATAKDRILIGLPAGRPGSAGDLLTQAVERLGATPIALSDPDQEQATCIIGIPVQVLALANRGNLRRIECVVLCSDHVSDGLVDALKQAWGCEVFEHYGMTEMGLGGGVDCAAHSGYHLRERDLYFEIVDPETGVPVPAGHCGEIVFTTLTRKAMPLIRYRTGDISRLLPGSCACGKISPRLERVRARKSEPVNLSPHGELSIADLDDRLFAISGVNDFAASLAPGKLTITASTSRTGLEGQMLCALRSVPAISRASAAGDLTIDVKIAPGPFRPTSEKRRIQCCTS